MYIKFIQHRKIFYIFSIILVGLSIASIIIFGLNLGIDFTGGSSLEVSYQGEVPSSGAVKQALQPLNLGDVMVQKTGQRGIILKMRAIKENTHQKILLKLKQIGKIEEGSESFQMIGPLIGKELKSKTRVVIILALIGILFYVAFSFRRISKPVPSYVYGFTSLIALGHDVLLPLGVFAVLGKFYGTEVSIPIITALLTVFGYSINDSVVVFDRVRENLLKRKDPNFGGLVEKSLNQSLVRSLNTSLTTLLVLFSIFFFGGETLKYFSLALIIGITAGTYSSLCLATPLLVDFLRLKERKYHKGVSD